MPDLELGPRPNGSCGPGQTKWGSKACQFTEGCAGMAFGMANIFSNRQRRAAAPNHRCNCSRTGASSVLAVLAEESESVITLAQMRLAPAGAYVGATSLRIHA